MRTQTHKQQHIHTHTHTHTHAHSIATPQPHIHIYYIYKHTNTAIQSNAHMNALRYATEINLKHTHTLRPLTSPEHVVPLLGVHMAKGIITDKLYF